MKPAQSMNKSLLVMLALVLAGCATTEQVDLEEGRKQLAARQIGNDPGRTPASPPSGISAAETRTLTVQATQGNAVSQIRLGALYEVGNGVPQDFFRAHMWYNVAGAALSGDSRKHAMEHRAHVASQMTAAQIEKAQGMARRCQETNFKECD